MDGRESMLESKHTQFTLSAQGNILWQEKPNNPLPGEAVAVLEKGVHPLKPVVTLLDNEVTAQYCAQEDKKLEVLNFLKVWLKWHMGEVIGALVNLEVPQGVEQKDDAVSKIADRVYEGMGIVPRENIEDVISALTPETRADLRAKKIRLGPVLVFIPELNKPAAVRLKGFLWSLYNGRDLPAQLPADGIVSMEVSDEQKDDILYYRSIGYPLYGGRAVRIDMLDRVISCVYDHADKGKFRARHEMAEWLGCSIEGLYKVLEAMGHKKIYDPAQEVKEESPEEGAQEAVKSDIQDDVKDLESGEEKSPEKPDLAVFRLKKGKAFRLAGGKGDGGNYKKVSKFNKAGKDKSGAKVKKFSKSKSRNNNKERAPRVISAKAKVDEADNPFAVLQQLKK